MAKEQPDTWPLRTHRRATWPAISRPLGTSVMRIGGNTADETFWTSPGETPPSWSTATIKVILGVNLKHYDPARASDEAAHAVAALGASLQAIEIARGADRGV